MGQKDVDRRVFGMYVVTMWGEYTDSNRISTDKKLNLWSRVFLNKPIFPQLVKNFSSFLWKTKVHYRIQNSPPLFPILSHTNSVHTLSSCWLKVRSSIIWSYLHLGFPSGFLPSGVTMTILYIFLFFPCSVLCPIDLNVLELITQVSVWYYK